MGNVRLSNKAAHFFKRTKNINASCPFELANTSAFTSGTHCHLAGYLIFQLCSFHSFSLASTNVRRLRLRGLIFRVECTLRTVEYIHVKKPVIFYSRPSRSVLFLLMLFCHNPIVFTGGRRSQTVSRRPLVGSRRSVPAYFGSRHSSLPDACL